ncbi:MAG TPA: VWA domain-containing protein [Pedococcus sp.]|jgi:Ca-activated chloride channel family protein|uniref:VWA domain-containing protein n=1 Tax=Pedococcus sp. TaxID=2860345 RepID=UPI002F92FF11
MSFAWPWALAVLLVLPALTAAYLWQLRRRRRVAVRHSQVALVRAAAPPSARWRRHVPFALVLASLGLLGLAGARPQVEAEVPTAGTAVILALDVSGSMCATDVEPNRLTAAQEAVRDFVSAQEDDLRIGLVLFSGFAQLAVPPSTDREAVLRAVDTLTTGRGTTIGAAILKSVDAIAEINPNVAPADPGDERGADVQGTPAPATPSGPPGSSPQGGRPDPVPEIIVLLTDGANTRGVTPEAAAEQAAARGVRVFPIGFGTTNPTRLFCTREQLGAGDVNRFGSGLGGFGRDGRNFLVVDEDALREVADTTGGTYFRASDADQLQGVLADLPRHVDRQTREVEVSAGLVALAALALLAAVGLSARWRVFP